jgi:LysR family glycine cleavage system transcriptional activator
MPVLAATDLHAARLVTPFSLRVPLVSAYFLVSHQSTADRPAVTAFREWLLAEAARGEEA